MMLLGGAPQLIVVRSRPAGFLHRMLRPLVKGLAQKLRTGSSELDDSRPAARYRDRCNTSGALHLMSILVTLAVPHGCQ
jgi:hypothetical protein